jgi:hypothetical protein
MSTIFSNPGWGDWTGVDLFGPQFRYRAHWEGLAVIVSWGEGERTDVDPLGPQFRHRTY